MRTSSQPRAARTPYKANNILLAAQSVGRSNHHLLDFRQVQSVDGHENHEECARRVPGRSRRLGNGNRG